MSELEYTQVWSLALQPCRPISDNTLLFLSISHKTICYLLKKAPFGNTGDHFKEEKLEKKYFFSLPSVSPTLCCHIIFLKYRSYHDMNMLNTFNNSPLAYQLKLNHMSV